MSAKISVIIPALNEASEIGKTLDSIKAIEGDLQIIVADGGSTDATVEIAKQFGACVVTSERGRGIQLDAGSSAADADILWFLHADSIPSPDSANQIINSLKDPEVVGGNLTLVFNGESRPARFMTRFYAHLPKIGLRYGDSGIFVRRSVYEQAGGFKPMPLFEDVDLLARLKNHGKLVTLDSKIVTSSRRFADRAFVPVFLRWIIFQGLYWIGVNPKLLARSYHPADRNRPKTS